MPQLPFMLPRRPLHALSPYGPTQLPQLFHRLSLGIAMYIQCRKPLILSQSLQLASIHHLGLILHLHIGLMLEAARRICGMSIKE